MPPIIQPTKEFVKIEINPGVLSKKGAKPQMKLASQLLEIYKELSIVFMGTPDFSVPILEALCQSDFKPKSIITAPDRPAGRGQEITPPPVKIIAQKYGVPVFQPQTKEELTIQTLNLKPDLIIVAAYGKILPKEILDLPKYGSINVHPSLLPKYRGASPIQFAILGGEAKTGVTIMLMNERMDEGAVLAQETVKIESDDTAETLEEKLSRLSAKLLIKTMNQWLVLKEMPKSAQRLIYPQEQDGSKATYTKILTKQDGKIIWNKTAKEIDCQIRAFTPWPGSFTVFRNSAKTQNEEKILTLKILKAAASKAQTDKELGQVFLTDNKNLAVQTGHDSLIIQELQLEGGKPMPASEFLNGHPEIVGIILQ
ncbi:MAG: methionyl-tRNA formyltransferase [bacterium]